MQAAADDFIEMLLLCISVTTVILVALIAIKNERTNDRPTEQWGILIDGIILSGFSRYAYSRQVSNYGTLCRTTLIG